MYIFTSRLSCDYIERLALHYTVWHIAISRLNYFRFSIVTHRTSVSLNHVLSYCYRRKCTFNVIET